MGRPQKHTPMCVRCKLVLSHYLMRCVRTVWGERSTSVLSARTESATREPPDQRDYGSFIGPRSAASTLRVHPHSGYILTCSSSDGGPEPSTHFGTRGSDLP